MKRTSPEMSHVTQSNRARATRSMLLCTAALGVLQLAASNAQAGAVILGQIDPPGIFNGASSLTFDGASDPLAIDYFGTVMWRLDVQDASVVATHPLSTGQAATRGLTFDSNTGVYYVSRRTSSADDFLTTVNPSTGAPRSGLSPLTVYLSFRRLSDMTLETQLVLPKPGYGHLRRFGARKSRH